MIAIKSAGNVKALSVLNRPERALHAFRMKNVTPVTITAMAIAAVRKGMSDAFIILLVYVVFGTSAMGRALPGRLGRSNPDILQCTVRPSATILEPAAR